MTDSGSRGVAPPSAEGRTAIARFLVANRERCPYLREEDVAEFLRLTGALHLNGFDVRSIVRSAWLAGIGERPPSRSRVARMTFTETTLGRPGSAAETDVLPSLLWAVAEAECDSLPQINRILMQVAEGSFGASEGSFGASEGSVGASEGSVGASENVSGPTRGTANRDLSRFLAAHPGCVREPNNAGRIERFLDLIESENLVGEDIVALLRTLSLQGRITPLMTRSGWRTADLALTPETLGRPGSRQREIVKHSLLWDVLEKYCTQMGPIVASATDLLSGRLASREPAPSIAPRVPSSAVASSIPSALASGAPSVASIIPRSFIPPSVPRPIPPSVRRPLPPSVSVVRPLIPSGVPPSVRSLAVPSTPRRLDERVAAVGRERKTTRDIVALLNAPDLSRALVGLDRFSRQEIRDEYNARVLATLNDYAARTPAGTPSIPTGQVAEGLVRGEIQSLLDETSRPALPSPSAPSSAAARLLNRGWSQIAEDVRSASTGADYPASQEVLRDRWNAFAAPTAVRLLTGEVPSDPQGVERLTEGLEERFLAQLTGEPTPAEGTRTEEESEVREEEEPYPVESETPFVAESETQFVGESGLERLTALLNAEFWTNGETLDNLYPTVREATASPFCGSINRLRDVYNAEILRRRTEYLDPRRLSTTEFQQIGLEALADALAFVRGRLPPPRTEPGLQEAAFLLNEPWRDVPEGEPRTQACVEEQTARNRWNSAVAITALSLVSDPQTLPDRAELAAFVSSLRESLLETPQQGRPTRAEFQRRTRELLVALLNVSLWTDPSTLERIETNLTLAGAFSGVPVLLRRCEVIQEIRNAYTDRILRSLAEVAVARRLPDLTEEEALELANRAFSAANELAAPLPPLPEGTRLWAANYVLSSPWTGTEAARFGRSLTDCIATQAARDRYNLLATETAARFLVASLPSTANVVIRQTDAVIEAFNAAEDERLRTQA